MGRVKARRFVKPSGRRAVSDEDKAKIYQLDLPIARDLTAAFCALASTIWHGRSQERSHRDTLLELGHKAIPAIRQLRLPEDSWNNIIKEAHATGDVNDNRDALDGILKSMIQVDREIRLNHTQNPVLVDLLNNARLACNGSENGYKAVAQNVGLLNNPALNSLVEQGEGGLGAHDQQAHMETWKGILKKLGAKPDQLNLNLPQINKAREAQPKTYQLFLDMRRTLFAKAKGFIRSFVRSHADKDGLTDYQKLREAMIRHKIDVHHLPTGFVGKIDENCRLFTERGVLIKGSLPGAASGGAVITMNPNYDHDKDDTNVFHAKVEGDAGGQYGYTSTFKKGRSEVKFEKAELLGDNLPKIRKAWREWLKEIDPEEDAKDSDYLSAVVLEMIYQTSARVGSVGNKSKVDPVTKKKSKNGVYMPTFGLSTLLCKHVKETKSGGIKISYPGKSYMQQTHIIEPEGPSSRKVIECIKHWKAARKPNDPLFMTQRGAQLGGTNVNAMLRWLMAEEAGIDFKSMTKEQQSKLMDAGIHKVRTYKGTTMMNKIVDANPFKAKKEPTRTQTVTQWLKEEASEIGEELGHYSGENPTAATAIANYCDPKKMIQLYKDARTAPDRQILELVGIDTKSLQGWEDTHDADLDASKVQDTSE